MKIPLYKGVKEKLPRSDPSTTNLGLYFNKFCDKWKAGTSWDLEKAEFIRKIKNLSDKIDSDLIRDHIGRRYRLTYECGGSFKIFELTQALVTGVGLAHPVEVGFLWDHSLGVPIIQGSSIKGLVKDWAKDWNYADGEALHRIFGSKDDKDSQAGSVIFFDALPFGALHLKEEIIAPHYSDYYSQGGVPGDWSNPTPISFLALDRPQRFIFFVAPRRPEDQEDCQKALKYLEDVLTTLGAGAKTATGFGQFVPAESTQRAYDSQQQEKTEEEERQRRLKTMTPIQKEMEEDGYSTDEDIFMEELTVKWQKRLEGDAEQEEKQEIARLLAQWYKKHRPKQWKKPKGKNIEKVELIKSFL